MAQDHGRPGWNSNGTVVDGVEDTRSGPVLVGDNMPGTRPWEVYCLGLYSGIDSYHDCLPWITIGMMVQGENNAALF